MLDRIVQEAAARYGDRPHAVAVDGSVLTYRDLDRLSDRVAGGLAGAGVGAGDVVGLLLPSGAAYTVLYAAAAKLGR